MRTPASVSCIPQEMFICEINKCVVSHAFPGILIKWQQKERNQRKQLKPQSQSLSDNSNNTVYRLFMFCTKCCSRIAIADAHKFDINVFDSCRIKFPFRMLWGVCSKRTVVFDLTCTNINICIGRTVDFVPIWQWNWCNYLPTAENHRDQQRVQHFLSCVFVCVRYLWRKKLECIQSRLQRSLPIKETLPAKLKH